MGTTTLDDIDKALMLLNKTIRFTNGLRINAIKTDHLGVAVKATKTRDALHELVKDLESKREIFIHKLVKDGSMRKVPIEFNGRPKLTIVKRRK